MPVVDGSVFSTNVAALSITVPYPSGSRLLVIKDRTNTPLTIEQRDCPCIFPQAQFQRNYAESRQSVGTGANVFWEVTWDACYYFAYMPVASGRFTYTNENDQNISLGLQAIADAISAACTALGVTEVYLKSSTSTKLVPDPANHSFYGAEFVLSVRDYRNL